MYLLDTNIISELYKLRNGHIDPHCRQWLASIKPSQTFISCISLAEIKTGILLKARKDPQQAQLLHHWFEQQILPIYQTRIVPLSAEIALLAAEFHIPNKMNINDAYIAATAQYQRLTLVTRNVQDFTQLDIEIINPFEPQ